MKKVQLFCLCGIAALMLASCTCGRCRGTCMEIAATDGVHPYTGQPYEEGNAIPCLRCGGKGHGHGDATTGMYSPTRAAGNGMLRSPILSL